MSLASRPLTTAERNRLRAVRCGVARGVYGRRLTSILRSMGYVRDKHPNRGSLDLKRAAKAIATRTKKRCPVGVLEQYTSGRREPTLSTAEWLAKGLGFNPAAWFLDMD